MTALNPMRQVPALAKYKKGDVLVVFGELFSRGYANGIVDEAERVGLTVIRSTVGRRDEEGRLRPLNETELKTQSKPFINVPLEAGFDLEPSSDDPATAQTPVQQLAGLKLGDWEGAKLDWEKIEASRKRGAEGFRKRVKAYMTELNSLIPPGANVIFAHTMAGGVPRAKIMMPAMNRVFKGTGDRYFGSDVFWATALGRLSSLSFNEVTAETFSHLIDLSSPIRTRVESEGGTVRYVAYGYHGTEVLIGDEYQWQSYAPYLQGWSKIKLEEIAQNAWSKGLKATVYNCPEILTNSSSIFVGVEVPLYPFIAALKKEGAKTAAVQETLHAAEELLKPSITFDAIKSFTDKALKAPEIRAQAEFSKWPQHSSKAQLETLIKAAQELIDMHKDTKQLITFGLSEQIFRATGHIMFNDSFNLSKPVWWLGHDVLARALASGNTL